MPISDYHHIPYVLHIVEQLKPKSILDIGIGFGIFGYLYRQVLELYQGLNLKESDLIVDGIEIFAGIKNPLWDMAYNNVFREDALSLLDKLGHYELITACDIIEHLSKEEGRILIEKMLNHADIVILTTPTSFIENQTFFGDIYDIHKSLWSKRDFSNIPHLYKEVGFTFLVVLSSDKKKLKSINILRPSLDTLGVKKGFVELLKLMLYRIKLKIKCLLP